MVLATHALVGAVIGKNIENPWIIVAMSLPIHYILDSVRHGEYLETFDSPQALKNSYWKIILDIAIAAIIIFFLIYLEKLDLITIRNMLIGVFASLFPDFLTLLYWIFHWKFLEKLYKFHAWIHHLSRSAMERQWKLSNEIYEILIFIASIILLFAF